MNSFKEKGKYFNVKSECGVFSALGKLYPPTHTYRHNPKYHCKYRYEWQNKQ